MYTMRGFGPGQPAWKRVQAAIAKGNSQEEINKMMAPYVGASVKKARKAAGATLSGRTGLLAASVSAYMNEADTTLPPEGTPIVPKVVRQSDEEVQQQMSSAPVQQNQDIANSLSKSIMDLISSAQSVQGTGTSGLEEGKAIAGNR
tara:strand:+ start:73 stop:510 length:438 start_codon:yes stop_codon:yes gene_type:complete